MTSVAASPTSAVSPSLCHIASRVCSMTPSKPSSAAMRSRSPTSGLPLTPPAPAGLRLIPSRPAVEPVDAAQHRVRAAEQEVPERRRLGVLEVGLVDHQRLGVRVGDPGDGGDEPGGRLDQVGDVAAHPQPQRDPHGLTAGPSGVQPTRVAPDRRGEPALAAVVDLAVRGVVAELGPGRGDGVAQHAEQRAGGRVRDDAALAQDEHVRDVGDVQAVVQAAARRPPRRRTRRRPARAAYRLTACARSSRVRRVSARPDRERHRPEVGHAEVGQAAQLLLDVRLGPDHRERTHRRHALALELPPVVVQPVVAGEADLGGGAGRVRVVVHGDRAARRPAGCPARPSAGSRPRPPRSAARRAT